VSTGDRVRSEVALLDTALRLVEERSDLAAGSVLRCFSRAVLVLRRARVPAEDLPVEAEALTRLLLAARSGSSTATSVRLLGTPAAGAVALA
jgi:hypothetical protein